ncbi:hypothetical protein FOH38_22995 [Lysinibacillus fusiformis]|nr:hypothetical protein FOH38_22995 [Lysinibacillus fusiformis]
MSKIVKFQIEADGGGQKQRDKTLEKPSPEKLTISHEQYDYPQITAELSQEQVHKMMQVIEEIRLNRPK